MALSLKQTWQNLKKLTKNWPGQFFPGGQFFSISLDSGSVEQPGMCHIDATSGKYFRVDFPPLSADTAHPVTEKNWHSRKNWPIWKNWPKKLTGQFFRECQFFSVTGWAVSADSGWKSRVRYFPEVASIRDIPGCSKLSESKEIEKNWPPGKKWPGQFLVSFFRFCQVCSRLRAIQNYITTPKMWLRV